VIYIQRIIKPTEMVTNFWCPLCEKEIFKGANREKRNLQIAPTNNKRKEE